MSTERGRLLSQNIKHIEKLEYLLEKGRGRVRKERDTQEGVPQKERPKFRTIKDEVLTKKKNIRKVCSQFEGGVRKTRKLGESWMLRWRSVSWERDPIRKPNRGSLKHNRKAFYRRRGMVQSPRQAGSPKDKVREVASFQEVFLSRRRAKTKDNP